MNELQEEFEVSERRARRLVGQPRQTQRYQSKTPDDEPALVKDIMELVKQHPRYGYRLTCRKLRHQGWAINPKRVYRLRKKLGLKVPEKKCKKRRLGGSDNSIMRSSSAYKNHVWSWDFVFDRTVNGKALKWLVIVDEFTRENVFLEVERNFKSEDVIEQLFAMSVERGLLEYIRSDNGSELIAGPLRAWLKKLDVKTLYIEPASPWQNGYAESFNSRFRDEFLAMEQFDNLQSAKILSRIWRTDYNQNRPHSSLGYKTAIEFARECSSSVPCIPSSENSLLAATAGK